MTLFWATLDGDWTRLEAAVRHLAMFKRWSPRSLVQMYQRGWMRRWTRRLHNWGVVSGAKKPWIASRSCQGPNVGSGSKQGLPGNKRFPSTSKIPLRMLRAISDARGNNSDMGTKGSQILKSTNGHWCTASQRD